MQKLKTVLIGITVLGALASAGIAQNQATVASPPVATAEINALNATTDAFEKSVKTQADSIEVELYAPNADRTALKKKIQNLEDGLMQRLHDDKFTTDATILAVVYVWGDYEIPLPPPAKQAYSEGKRFIDSLIPLLNDRPYLQAQLYWHKGNLFMNGGNFADASKEYENQLNILNPLHVEIDLQRMQSTADLANLQIGLGNKKEAETLYLEVLSYPWYNDPNPPEAYQRLFSLYLQAGRGVIELRRHNLAALKDTYFEPAANPKLQPLLQEYIKEAQDEASGKIPYPH